MPDLALILQLKESLVHCRPTRFRLVVAHPICLQTLGARKHGLNHLIDLKQTDLARVDVQQSQVGAHLNCQRRKIQEEKGLGGEQVCNLHGSSAHIEII